VCNERARALGPLPVPCIKISSTVVRERLPGFGVDRMGNPGLSERSDPGGRSDDEPRTSGYRNSER